MNILYICETPRYGVGTHLMDLCENMISSGHNVCIMWSKERSSEEFRSWLKLNSSKIISVEIKMKREIGLSDIGVIISINSFLKNNFFNPEIIHGHSSKGGAYAAIISFIQQKISIYSPHAFAFTSKYKRGFIIDFKWFIEFILSRKRYIIATSKSEMTLAKTLHPKGIKYIPNGINIKNSENFKFDKNVDNAFKVSFVGRLEDQKNPLLFIKIASEVLKSSKNIEFNVFGNGKLLNAVQDKIYNLKLSNKVFLHGERSLKYIFNNSHVLICTSEYEGFPYLFIQSISNGIPIITTDVGGAQEVTDAGKIGLIFKKNNICPVKNYVQQLSNNPETYKKISRAAQLLSKDFCKDHMSQKTIRLYRESLKELS